MAFDGHANFAYSTVDTAPSPATSGTSLVLDDAADFPDPSSAGAYNIVIWPAGELPLSSNAEIVRVTGKSSDTLTITRTQEGTSARTVTTGDQVALAITKKTFTDVEAYLAQKDYLKDNYDQAEYPTSANALDDEFEGGGSIDAKWTKVNDPSAGDALNQTDYPGFLHVGLTENGGTDNFDALVRLYQTPPTGTSTMTFIAKCGIVVADDPFGADDGEFASVGIYLGESGNDQMVGVCFQLNNQTTTTPQARINLIIAGQRDNGSGGISEATSTKPVMSLYGTHIWLKLVKTTANAYNASNTYKMYCSLDGVLWQHVGTETKTFTSNCNEVGLFFRRPKSVGDATPKAEAIVDCFRRTA